MSEIKLFVSNFKFVRSKNKSKKNTVTICDHRDLNWFFVYSPHLGQLVEHFLLPSCSPFGSQFLSGVLEICRMGHLYPINAHFTFGKTLGLGVKHLRCGNKYSGKVEERTYWDSVRFTHLLLNWVEMSPFGALCY